MIRGNDEQFTDERVLDTALRDLQARIERAKDRDKSELKWLYDSLFKALALRRKTAPQRKGRGFDLG
jgi:hypothetical protein